MKLAAAVVVAAALVLPAAQAAPGKIVSPVLGLDVARNGVHRLAWFEQGDLTMLHGRKAPLGRYTGRWSFSPDRSVLAIAVAQTTGYQQQPQFKLRFVNARRMRVLGDLDLGDPQLGSVTWLRSDRLLAITYGPSVVVVDPERRTVVRRVPLVRPVEAVAQLPEGLALLLGSAGSLAPAMLAVVDAGGSVREVELDRISIGSVFGSDSRMEVRSPGFAVDAAGRRAFVVGADFAVAEVALDTLAVRYHGGSVRSLAKYVSGPRRYALWLGNGLLAVAGTDYAGDETTKGQPLGLRLVDTHDWHTRLVDPNVGYVWRLPDNPMFVAGGNVYDMDATLRYRLDVRDGEWLSVHGPYAYVCGTSKDRVLRVLDVRSGADLGLTGERPACPTLLYGQSG